MQFAEHTPNYWIFLDVSECKGQKTKFSGLYSQTTLDAIYQTNTIERATTSTKNSIVPKFISP